MSKILNLRSIKSADIKLDIFSQRYTKEEYSDGDSIFQCIKINSKKQLFWLFEQIRQTSKDGYFIFRGQRNCHWKPLSSIERVEGVAAGIEYFEQKHFDNFKKLARGKISEQFLLKPSQEIEDKNELWAVGQHMGLKTPLMDWTRSIYVALYFAFEEKVNNSSYRAVFCLDGSILDNGIAYVSEIFEPASDPYGRLTAQQGLFITRKALPQVRDRLERLYKYKPEEINKINIRCARKFLISEKLREEIMDYLEHLGIKKETIYPDLAGVIMKANDDLDLSIKWKNLPKVS